ncbi:MAG: helix-turn-helix domain-containing protein [Chloroflexota bacterium]
MPRRKTPADEIDLLTIDEVADVLRVRWWTVRRLVRAGKLPAVYVGRALRFQRKDVVAFVRANTRRGT